MLVISRREEEFVQIGPDIRVTFTRDLNNQVRLGIEAPRSVRVLRGELLPPGWEWGDPVPDRRRDRDVDADADDGAAA